MLPSCYFLVVVLAFVLELLTPVAAALAVITAGEGSLSSSVNPPG